jgi:hypothetical protein
MEGRCQLHTSASLFLGKEAKYLLDRRLGESQSQSGYVGCKEKKSLPLLEI